MLLKTSLHAVPAANDFATIARAVNGLNVNNAVVGSTMPVKGYRKDHSIHLFASNVLTIQAKATYKLT